MHLREKGDLTTKQVRCKCCQNIDKTGALLYDLAL